MDHRRRALPAVEGRDQIDREPLVVGKWLQATVVLGGLLAQRDDLHPGCGLGGFIPTGLIAPVGAMGPTSEAAAG
ncbi:MAG: hypothetical protein ABJA16_07650 [Nakamurella sp.]